MTLESNADDVLAHGFTFVNSVVGQVLFFNHISDGRSKEARSIVVLQTEDRAEHDSLGFLTKAGPLIFVMRSDFQKLLVTVQRRDLMHTPISFRFSAGDGQTLEEVVIDGKPVRAPSKRASDFREVKPPGEGDPGYGQGGRK